MTHARNIRPLTLRPTSLWQKTTIQIFTVVKQRVFWIRSQFGNGYSAKRWVRKTVNFAEGTKKTYRRRQTDRQTLNICRKSRTTWSVLEWKESEVSGIWFQRRIKSKFIWSVWRSKLLILQFVGVNILAILFLKSHVLFEGFRNKTHKNKYGSRNFGERRISFEYLTKGTAVSQKYITQKKKNSPSLSK